MEKFKSSHGSENPPRPGERAKTSGQYNETDSTGKSPDNKGRVSVSQGKYGGKPRKDNVIDKVITRVFGG